MTGLERLTYSEIHWVARMVIPMGIQKETRSVTPMLTEID